VENATYWMMVLTGADSVDDLRVSLCVSLIHLLRIIEHKQKTMA